MKKNRLLTLAATSIGAGALLFVLWSWYLGGLNLQPSKPAEVVAQNTIKTIRSLPKPVVEKKIRHVVIQPAGAVTVPAVLPDAPDAVKDFRNWAESYYAAAPEARAKLIKKGTELALAQRAVIKQTIPNNPKLALDLAVPMVVRQDLPDEVESQLEHRVNDRGSLLVLATLPSQDGKDAGLQASPYQHLFKRENAAPGESLKAYVYGDRQKMRSLNSARVSGVEVDGQFAVLDSPIRQLEEGERPDPTKEAVEVCPISGITTPVERVADASPAPVRRERAVVEDNKKLYFLCAGGHSGIFAAQLRNTEAKEHWDGLILAEGGSGGGITPFDVPPGWTTGTKTLLYLRVAFPDRLSDPQNETSVYANLKRTTDYFMTNSYGRFYLTPTVAPLVVLPYAESWYNASRSSGGDSNGDFILRDHALEIAKRMGYDTDSYDLDIVEYRNGPGGFSGQGYVGTKGTWLKTSSLSTLIHELGHNLGVWHANRWQTNPPSITGPGNNDEYGNKFDVMGESGTALGHYVAVHKAILNWLPPEAVHRATSNGTFRIYQVDQVQADADKRYALAVNKDSERDYWFEFRQGIFDDKGVSNLPSQFLGGLMVTSTAWGSGYSPAFSTAFGSENGSHLLDMTPGSGSFADTRDDAALTIGSTYSDGDVDVHITPVLKSSSTPPYVDVVVNRGPFPGNRAPALSLAVDKTSIVLAASARFTATGTDLDGDTLAYAWDFGDGSVSTDNARIQNKKWDAGGEYRVLCTVSDMKGKRTTKGIIVKVDLSFLAATPRRHKIGGKILDANDDPIEGVYVTNRPLVTVAEQPNSQEFRYAYTDSEGVYMLTNVPDGGIQIVASKWPLSMVPVNTAIFTPSSDVRSEKYDRLDIDWVSPSTVAAVTVTVTDASASEAGPDNGQITLTRSITTGILNVQLMVGSRGTATRGASTIAPQDYLIRSVPPMSGNPILPTQVTTNGRPELAGCLGVSFANNVGTLVLNIIPQNDTISEGTEYAVIEFPDTAYAMPNVNALRTVPYHVAGARTAVITIADDDSSLPVVSLTAADSSLLESGDPGSVRLFRNGSTAAPLTVTVGYSGQGVHSTDFTAPAAVVIPAGKDSVLFSLTPIEDLIAEGTEAITISLTANASYIIDNKLNTGSVFLLDNDQPVVSVVVVTPTTAEGSATPGRFTVSRAAVDIGEDLVVNFSLGGSALSGSDYKRVDGVVTIPANELTADVMIESFQDTVDEENQTVIFRLATNENYSISHTRSTGTVTIMDDDISQFTVQTTNSPAKEPINNVVSAQFGQRTSMFNVSRPAAGTAVTVKYSVSGTATSFLQGSTGIDKKDYLVLSGELRFKADETTLPIAVTIFPDDIDEAPETITITLSPVLLSDGYRLGTATRSTGFILERDTAVGQNVFAATVVDVSLADQSALENSQEPSGSLTSNIRFYFSRTGSTASALTVPFTTGGTAVLGTDYTIATNASQSPTGVGIPPNSGGVFLTVVLIGDGVADGTKTLEITVADDASNYETRLKTASVTIDDADIYALKVGFTAPASVVEEGQSLLIPVSLSAPASDPTRVGVSYRVYGGSATGRKNNVDSAGVDYTLLGGGQLEFAPGNAVLNITVQAVADATPEGDETIFLELFNPTNASLLTGVHVLTVQDKAIPEVLTDTVNIVPTAPNAVAGAQLRGRAMPNNHPTFSWFEWGTSRTKLNNVTTNIDAGSGTTFFNMSHTITGLKYPGTYFYRAVAENDKGKTRGIIRMIRTLAPPTVVTTVDAGHTASTVTVAGTINPNRGIVDYYFVWGSTSTILNNVTPTQTLANGTVPSKVTSTITGLSEGALVYYQLVVVSRAGLGTEPGGITRGLVKFSSAIPFRASGDLIVNVHASQPSAGSASWANLGFPQGVFVQTAITVVEPSVYGTGIPGVFFNGKDVAYQLAAPPADIIGSDSRSIEIWAFNPGYGTPDTLVSMGKEGVEGRSLAISHSSLVEPNSALRHGAIVKSNASYKATDLPPLGRWNYFTYVYDGKKTATLYINGVKKITAAPGLLATSTDPLVIGAALDSSDVLQRFMHGYINSVRVHGGMLTPADVLANFKFGPTRSAAAAPVVSTTGVSDLTTTTATLNGLAASNGAPSTAWIEWGTAGTPYDNASPAVSMGALDSPLAVPVVLNVTNLVPGVAYHFRVAAANSVATSYGDEVIFTPQVLAGKGKLWVDLRAAEFTDGTAWANTGALGGFSAIGSPILTADVLSTGYPGIELNGTTQAFESLLPASLDFSHGDDQTMEAWVLNPTLGSPAETVVNEGRVITPSSRLRLSYGTAGGLDDNSTTNNTWTTAPIAGRWTHLAVVVSGSSRMLYVNGVEVSKTNHPAGMNHWGDKVLIGAARDMAGALLFGADGFSGYINAVRIQGGALLPAQIKTSYLMGPSQAPAALGLAPTVITSAASLITDVNATLNGTVQGGALSTTYWFEWGTSASFGSITPPTVLPTSFAPNTVTGQIGGLPPGTIHYRLVAQNALGTINGSTLTFPTGAPVVGVAKAVTSPATGIALGKATLNGTATPSGVASTAWFEYGPTSALGLASKPVVIAATAAPKVMIFAAAGILPHRIYYFRLVVENTNGKVAGSTLFFNSFNAVPVASVGTLKVLENVPTPIILKGSDADKEPLTYVISTAPVKGAISGVSPNFIYTSTANLSGSDTFQFTASDGVATSSAALMNVTITPVNDAPVAVASMVTANEGSVITGNAVGSDEEGDPITAYQLVSAPATGFTLNSTTGAFSYTPEANFFGSTSFVFRVVAGGKTSAPATVTLTLTGLPDAPVAMATGVWTAMNDDVDAVALAEDADGDSLTYTKISDPLPAGGTLSAFNNDGTFTFTPTLNYVGTASFTFKANDGTTDTNVATVTITVGGATAEDAEFSGVEDDQVAGQLEATILPVAPLTYSVVKQPEHGVLVIQLDGQFTYNPKAGFVGIDSFEFQASNGTLNSNPGIVSITITKRPPDWVWTQGANVAKVPGIYGVMGTAAAANQPGARTEPASWTEPDGTLWIFGGQGYAEGAKTAGALNDLWKRDPLSGQWAWVSGSKLINVKGNLGAQEITDPTNPPENYPGARSGASSWITPDGRLWLFGGNGFDASSVKLGILNDLWVYDSIVNKWTWLKGASINTVNGTYNAKGSPSTTGTPGSRQGATTWVDAAGSLWLYGGVGRPGLGILAGQLGDLWKYSPADDEWTWISGNSGINSNGVYGVPNEVSGATVPGARSYASSWQDSDGVFYLFGGFGFGATGKAAGYLNDLWAYYPESNRWAWLKGSITIGAPSVQGLLGVANSANVPSGRAGVMAWSNGGQTAFIHGGQAKTGHTNDLWRYDLGANTWTSLKGALGANLPGVYGILGRGAPSNTPGSRRGAAAYADASGDFWLFGGGNGANTFNDLWKLDVLDIARVTTLAATLITDTTATLNGEFEAVEGTLSAKIRYWPLGDIASVEVVDAREISSDEGVQTEDLAVTGLLIGKTYITQAFAETSTGTVYGKPLAFTTTGVASAIEVEFALASDASPESTANFNVQLKLTAPTPSPFTVPLSISGSAVLGVDYRAMPSTVTFAAGQSNAFITIPVINDSLTETADTLKITLGTPSALASLGSIFEFTFTINDDDFAPLITSQPLSQFATVGQDVTLTTTAAGSLLKYQWKKDGVAIAKATSSTLVFKASLASVGAYTCLISNSLDDAETDQAEIFAIDVKSTTVLQNSGNLSFTVNAAGPPNTNLVYRWYDVTTPPPTPDNALNNVIGRREGVLTPTMTLIGLIPTDSGRYLCRVSKSGVPTFFADSGTQTLSVPDAVPIITSTALPQGVKGLQYSYQVTVDSNLRRRPALYTAAGLPKGLTINRTTGLISGRPTAIFSGNVTITASNIVVIPAPIPVSLPLTIIDLPTAFQGTYVGLLPRAAATGNMGGRVDLTIGALGDYTLKLLLNGIAGSAKGVLTPNPGAVVTDVSGTAAFKRKGLPDLSLQFTVASAALAPGVLSSLILTDTLAAPTVAIGTGVRQTASALNVGDYTMILDLPASKLGDLEIPQGNGYMSLKRTADGKITGAGRTADGASFTIATVLGPNATVLSPNLEIPLFALFKPVLGSLHGTVAVGIDGYLTGQKISWSKGAAAATTKTLFYNAGFAPLDLSVIGGLYPTLANGAVVMDLPNLANKARLSFYEGGLLESELNSLIFSILNPNPLKTAQVISYANPNLNKLSFTLPKSPVGSFTGKVVILNPTSALTRNLTYQGVIAKISAVSGPASWKAAGYVLIPQLPQPGQTLTTSPVYSGQVTLDPAP